MNILEQVPPWLLRPLPVSATTNEKDNKRLDELAKKLPTSFYQLGYELNQISALTHYDTAINRVCARVWLKLDDLLQGDHYVKMNLLRFAQQHMVPQAVGRILRRLVKDADSGTRAKARQLINKGIVREIALPLERDGDWDQRGWMNGVVSVDRKHQIAGVDVTRHKHTNAVLDRFDLPHIASLSALRKLLGIKSPAQLGWFLLASDKENGPYTTFKIPKRGGEPRLICAPKSQLRWVQRQILDKILAKIPAHDAAHGFVVGRSTVTNATPHLGAKIILKFDLTDFFPTIHYHRVLGLFARLGYSVGNARFGTDNQSKQIAPVLARLCCYAPNPLERGDINLPQGAPTSPAISNLVCRRLDARLTGLAKRNKAIYTRYADDLTFSFKEEGANLGRFRWWVDQVCHQEGFFINHKKFRVIRAAQRQVVTGLVVNDELRVPRDERRRFRAILHNCKIHGIKSQKKKHKHFEDYLRGFASYVYMVQPDEGAELLKEVEALLGPAEGAS